MPGIVSVVIEEQNQGQLEKLSRLADFDRIAQPLMVDAMFTTMAIGKGKVISELRSVAEANRGAMISQLGGDIIPLAPVNPKIPQMRISSLVAGQGGMNVMGIIGDANKKYLRLTQDGRGPGKHPPVSKLQDWAENVLGVQPVPGKVIKSGKRKGQVRRDVSAGRAISHAIAQKGIKGSPVIEKSEEAVQKHILQLFDGVLKKIAEELGFK